MLNIPVYVSWGEMVDVLYIIDERDARIYAVINEKKEIWNKIIKKEDIDIAMRKWFVEKGLLVDEK